MGEIYRVAGGVILVEIIQNSFKIWVMDLLVYVYF